MRSCCNFETNIASAQVTSMKNILLVFLALLSTTLPLFAQKSAKDKEAKVDNSEIHWMSLDDAQVAMKKEPKKVWIDVYTDWCGWCKKMDRETFTNPHVIAYMNKYFYAVKLDAEQKNDIRFLGKMYKYEADKRVNAFAFEILNGQLSYPTSVFMVENFQQPAQIPGYQNVQGLEMILKYLNEGTYKTVQFPEYQKTFKNEWL